MSINRTEHNQKSYTMIDLRPQDQGVRPRPGLHETEAETKANYCEIETETETKIVVWTLETLT